MSLLKKLRWADHRHLRVPLSAIEQNPTDVRPSYSVMRENLGGPSKALTLPTDGLRHCGRLREVNMSLLRKVMIWSWLLLCFSGVALTGCHTAHGAGEDIAGAGRSIERATE